jgi:hypothetical protein
MILKKISCKGYSEQKKYLHLQAGEKISCPSIWMWQNSMVAGIDLTSPRRSAGLIFRD